VFDLDVEEYEISSSSEDETEAEEDHMIVYQIEGVKLFLRDIKTLRTPNWLSDEVIMGFMKCFSNKKLILNYAVATKLAGGQPINSNLFPEVNIYFVYKKKIIKNLSVCSQLLF